MSKMIIESYEPFHIGSKLIYYVDKGQLISKLYDHYEDNKMSGYKLNQDVLKGDRIFSPLIDIMTNPEEKLTLQMNLSANALNVIGNDSEKVINLFIELMKILPDLGFEIDSTFTFYEILTNVILLLEPEDKRPNEIFAKFSSNLFTNLEDIPGLKVNHIRFSSEFIPKENDERFNLEMYPNQTSPDKRIILRVLNRVKDYNKLIPFQEKLVTLINNIYNQMVE